MKTLLDFIGHFESRGDYNAVWGGIKRKDRPPRPLVEMTIGEVLDWQDRIDPHYMSEAAGKYQIMEDTLRGLYARSGFTRSDRFDQDTQDALAVELMDRRGLNEYIGGTITAEKFANSLAREWASLPLVTGPKRGRSYYAGDGLNAAHADPDEFLKAVKSVKKASTAPPAAPWWVHLSQAIARLWK